MSDLVLVDPAVTREKFATELAEWKARPEYRERGWVLLQVDESIPSAEIAFLAKVAISVGRGFLPVVVCAIRLAYDNYDLHPPSLTFIDAFSREATQPHVRAFVTAPEGARDVLIDGHPLTNLPFLCLPGIREYHTHPQHTGDDWLLHRPLKEGSLSVVCERVWLTMARNVVGLNVSLQALPVWPLRAQMEIHLGQGEFEGSLVAPPAINPSIKNSE